MPLGRARGRAHRKARKGKYKNGETLPCVPEVAALGNVRTGLGQVHEVREALGRHLLHLQAP
eukprot:8828654-Alexandrium_andersonii.AAC.1